MLAASFGSLATAPYYPFGIAFVVTHCCEA
jgi:hypothetical protein